MSAWSFVRLVQIGGRFDGGGGAAAAGAQPRTKNHFLLFVVAALKNKMLSLGLWSSGITLR